MKTTCRCHGPSQSCVKKTCWPKLPTITLIGRILKAKYRIGSRKVKPLLHGSRNGDIVSAIVLAKGPKNSKPRLRNLVYIKPSPSYCDKNVALNIAGTSGRLCNKTAEDMSGCKLLCCGRGYDTHKVMKEKMCKCKFHWCCMVKCKLCVRSIEKHRCK